MDAIGVALGKIRDNLMQNKKIFPTKKDKKVYEQTLHSYRNPWNSENSTPEFTIEEQRRINDVLRRMVPATYQKQGKVINIANPGTAIDLAG